jgi:hypothetical protein
MKQLLLFEWLKVKVFREHNIHFELLTINTRGDSGSMQQQLTSSLVEFFWVGSLFSDIMSHVSTCMHMRNFSALPLYVNGMF